MTRRQKASTFAFFALAFVVVPLFVAKWKAGGNLHSRVHRLWALHMSIQSGDPGRVAIEDPEADIAILEELRSGLVVFSVNGLVQQFRFRIRMDRSGNHEEDCCMNEDGTQHANLERSHPVLPSSRCQRSSASWELDVNLPPD